MGLVYSRIEHLVAKRLRRQRVELGQFAVQTVGFRQFQRGAGQMQPDQQTLHARALFSQIFGLLLIARKLQRLSFLGQQAGQPTAQLGSALAVAAVVALGSPCAL